MSGHDRKGEQKKCTMEGMQLASVKWHGQVSEEFQWGGDRSNLKSLCVMPQAMGTY